MIRLLEYTNISSNVIHLIMIHDPVKQQFSYILNQKWGRIKLDINSNLQKSGIFKYTDCDCAWPDIQSIKGLDMAHPCTLFLLVKK